MLLKVLNKCTLNADRLGASTTSLRSFQHLTNLVMKKLSLLSTLNLPCLSLVLFPHILSWVPWKEWPDLPLCFPSEEAHGSWRTKNGPSSLIALAPSNCLVNSLMQDDRLQEAEVINNWHTRPHKAQKYYWIRVNTMEKKKSDENKQSLNSPYSHFPNAALKYTNVTLLNVFSACFYLSCSGIILL